MDLLLVSTLICVLDHVTPFLVKFIISRQYARKKYDCDLRHQLMDLRWEMTGISMVNEFARYARLQRKYNKLESVLKDNMKQRYNWRTKLQLSLTYISYVMNGMLLLLLIYMYNNALVIDLPKDVLWPIQGLLSWPTQHKNGISLVNWIMIAKSGISSCKKLYK
ncbi:PREDICTED: tail-anchored protein insertion receptor WRB-like isoform X2 [Dinoponera quadriceps]|nr:PREDICTED: tail-anchored protein insertion receptor WRB-like isoform X2 [Dinoponera quadriceps]